MSTFMAVIMSTFGKRVRQLRLRKKLSQERLADLAGLHVSRRKAGQEAKAEELPEVIGGPAQ
jgi:transcriptional regulator with XRE-family HTH domain